MTAGGPVPAVAVCAGAAAVAGWPKADGAPAACPNPEGAAC